MIHMKAKLTVEKDKNTNHARHGAESITKPLQSQGLLLLHPAAQPSDLRAAKDVSIAGQYWQRTYMHTEYIVWADCIITVGTRPYAYV